MKYINIKKDVKYRFTYRFTYISYLHTKVPKYFEWQNFYDILIYRIFMLHITIFYTLSIQIWELPQDRRLSCID